MPKRSHWKPPTPSAALTLPPPSLNKAQHVPLPAPSLGPPVVAPPAWAQPQAEPVDFSKRKSSPPPAAVPPRRRVPREAVFHRNLLVLILRKIRDEPSYGRQLVRLLQLACSRAAPLRPSSASPPVISRGCSGRGGPPTQNGTNNHTNSGGNSSGGGSFGGYTSSGGGSPNSIRSGSSGGADNNPDDVLSFDASLEFASLDFDLPATRRWLSDNPELNPLKILDHISLKGGGGGFFGEAGGVPPKPPPPETVAAMDRDTASILSLAVPVPDPSATFLDIGTDLGPMSMYDEDDPFNLETVNPSNFAMSEPSGGGGSSGSPSPPAATATNVNGGSHYDPPMSKGMRTTTTTAGGSLYNNNNNNNNSNSLLSSNNTSNTSTAFPSLGAETSQPINSLYQAASLPQVLTSVYLYKYIFSIY